MDLSILKGKKKVSLEKIIQLRKENPDGTFRDLYKLGHLQSSTVNAAATDLGFKGISKFFEAYDNGKTTVVTYPNEKKTYSKRNKIQSNTNAFILIVQKNDLVSTLKDLIGE